MRWMALLAVGVAPLMLFLGTSCDDDGVETTGAGGSGAGGATTSTSTGSTSSGDCHGDPAAWANIKKTAISCSQNSDCCVVFNGCTAAGQVVGVDDYATAADLWPWCEDECNHLCLESAIAVECVNQLCVGYEVVPGADAGDDSGLRVDHCGEDDVVLQLPMPNTTFPCF